MNSTDNIPSTANTASTNNLNRSSSIFERLDRLRILIQEQDFLESKGLSNEVNISFFCYKPEEEMIIRDFVSRLLADKSLACNLIEQNLYKVFISLCDDKRITETVPSVEEKKGKAFLQAQLSRIASNTAFASKMQYEPHKLGDVLLITGVGDAFPFIRIHDLLNAMQPEFPDIPILVLYPGKYDGREVQLFNRLKKNPYYRAFNVIC